MARNIVLSFSGLLLLPLVGCSVYVEDFRYAPRPAVASLPTTQPQQEPPVVAFASVIGVRRADEKLGIPTAVEVRLRVENNGPSDVLFDPLSMELLDGMLVRFPAPILRPRDAAHLAPLQSAVFTAFFPFPPGHSYNDTDMDALQLRWSVRVMDHTAGQGANFHRMVRMYPPPYWDYPPPLLWGGGVVIVHRRR